MRNDEEGAFSDGQPVFLRASVHRFCISCCSVISQHRGASSWREGPRESSEAIVCNASIGSLFHFSATSPRRPPSGSINDWTGMQHGLPMSLESGGRSSLTMGHKTEQEASRNQKSCTLAKFAVVSKTLVNSYVCRIVTKTSIRQNF